MFPVLVITKAGTGFLGRIQVNVAKDVRAALTGDGMFCHTGRGFLGRIQVNVAKDVRAALTGDGMSCHTTGTVSLP